MKKVLGWSVLFLVFGSIFGLLGHQLGWGLVAGSIASAIGLSALVCWAADLIHGKEKQ